MREEDSSSGRSSNNIIKDTISRAKIMWTDNRQSLERQLWITLIISFLLTIWFSHIMENLLRFEDKLNFSIGRSISSWTQGGFVITIVIYLLMNIFIINIRRITKKNYTVDEERNYKVADSGVDGTARFLTDEEVEEKFDIGTINEKTEMIFGTLKDDDTQVVTPKVEYFAENLNICIVGMPGCGKSRCIILNMLFQILRRGESFIATDTKGDLARKVYKLAKKKGYHTKILNFKTNEIMYSDSIDLLKFINGSLNKAVTLSEIIMSNVKEDAKKDFWYDTGKQLLQVFILWVYFSKDIKDKSLSFIYDCVTKNSVSEIESMLSCISEDHPAFKPFNLYKGATPTIKESTRFGLGVALNMFNDPVIRKITSVDDVDLLKPGIDKCAYFLVMDDQDETYQPLVAIIVALLYMTLISYADSLPSQELPRKVNLVGDEFCNIGNIPAFLNKMSSVRSRGFVTALVVQDLGQFERKYPQNEWSSIMSSCMYKVLIQTDDEKTAKYFSDRSGDQTTLKNNITHDYDKMDIIQLHTEGKESESTGKRMLMTAHEIRTMDKDDLLLCKTGENIVLIHKLDYTKHPYAKHIEPFNPNMNIPMWWGGDTPPSNISYSETVQNSNFTQSAPETNKPSVWDKYNEKVGKNISVTFDRTAERKKKDEQEAKIREAVLRSSSSDK